MPYSVNVCDSHDSYIRYAASYTSGLQSACGQGADISRALLVASYCLTVHICSVQGSALLRTQEHMTKLWPHASTTRLEASCPRKFQPLTVVAAGPDHFSQGILALCHDTLIGLVFSAYFTPCVPAEKCVLTFANISVCKLSINCFCGDIFDSV